MTIGFPRIPRIRLTIPRYCRGCGATRRVRGTVRLCDVCRATMKPTPLDRWLAARGMTLGELAAKAKIARSTAQLLAAGERVSAATLAKVERVTRLEREQLTDPYRRRKP